MAFKFVKDEDNELEWIYEQNRPENTDYLHKTRAGYLHNRINYINL